MMPSERRRLRRNLALLAALLVALLGLTLAWRYGPLRERLDIEVMVATLQQIGRRFGPLAAIAGIALACALAVPLVLLTLVGVIAFGPIAGAGYVLIGGCLGSIASYGIGHWLGSAALRHLAGARVNQLSARLADKGVLAAIAMRLVPLAPFAVINMIAGSSHLRLRDFVIGSTLGMLPATVAIALFVDRFLAALRRPGPFSFALAGLTLALLATGALAARYWLARQR